ncbi:hypothetical protein PMAYCL1PPCAC_15632, partial [Pristionchus mayeri]
VFLLPIVTWVAVSGVPFHRNLRYIMALAIFHGWIGVIARGILLASQIFETDLRVFFIYFGFMSVLLIGIFISSYIFSFFGITTERFVDTNWSLWYEKQEHSTIFILYGITISLEVIAVMVAYMETFGITTSELTARII